VSGDSSEGVGAGAPDGATIEEQVRATRAAAGLLDRADRGLIFVRGGDRVRWLDGMLSGDVRALRPGPEGSGRYAALLTPKGAIVADLHVFALEDEIWLELSADVVSAVIERLERYIIADDVELLDGCGVYGQVSLEGPSARAILETASGDSPSLQPLQPDSLGQIAMAGHEIPLAAIAESGADGYRLFIPTTPAEARADVLAALHEAGVGAGLLRVERGAREILRIEAGVPALANELGDVLPDEACLERAISRDKGCYVGQEIVARVHSRGQVNRLLVGVRFEGEAVPAVGSRLEYEGRVVGELTSVCRSPEFGSIGLAFVRRKLAGDGQRLSVDGGSATVSALPFVEPQPRENR